MKPCKRGHPGRESYIDKRGDRICRACKREKQRAVYERDLRASTPGRTFTRRIGVLASEPVGVL